MSNPSTPDNTEQTILTKAFLNALVKMDIPQYRTASILAIDDEKAHQILSGLTLLNPNQAEWGNAVRLIDIYRQLAALLDGNENLIVDWLHSTNEHFGTTPAELLATPLGCQEIERYLTAIRQRI